MTGAPTIEEFELHNLHDLGGVETPRGPIRRGRLFRSANPDGLSVAGWRQLLDAGIRTIVDLRNDYEVAASSRPESLAARRRPIEDQSDDEFMAEWGDRLDSPEYYPAVTRLWPHLVADAVRAIADAPDGGVLIHCMAGRDRTGMITAILLELVGADRDAILDDYARGATTINAWWRIHGGPRESRTDAEIADYLLGARRTLNTFLDALDAPTYLA